MCIAMPCFSVDINHVSVMCHEVVTLYSEWNFIFMIHEVISELMMWFVNYSLLSWIWLEAELNLKSPLTENGSKPECKCLGSDVLF